MKDPAEAIYRIHGHYIFIQYLADDPEYLFDYTIYDNDFNNIDGGVVGIDASWNMDRVLKEILIMYPEIFASTPKRIDFNELSATEIDAFSDLIPL